MEKQRDSGDNWDPQMMAEHARAYSGFCFDSAMAAISHFRIARFRFVLQATEQINLPRYKGSTLRGALGNALIENACGEKDPNCAHCRRVESCVYHSVFMTDPHDDRPGPFVLIPPLSGKCQYQAGELLAFEIGLFGDSIDLLPHFIAGVKIMAARGLGRGRGKLEWVRFDPMQSFEALQKLQSFPVANCEQVRLDFQTPMRLVNEGMLVKKDPYFEVFMRRLAERLAAISFFYHSVMLDLDIDSIASSAATIVRTESTLQWCDWERYSNRQESRIRLGGLLGSITFRGDLKHFLPLIALGEATHAGKATTCGLGAYKIAEII